jgi:hypothetical protein
VRLALAAAAGALGLLPGAAGALDGTTLLGWLALLAPAAGALCRDVALFPFALVVPATWGCLVVLASSARAVPTPLWALAALTGLFALGLAGARRSRDDLRTAGLFLLGTTALGGLAVGFGLVAGGSELAKSHPALAARLLDLSPLVLVFDCAGLDWTHAQGEVYARAGVEWFQRRPYPGNLAGPAVLVVGCTLALLVGPIVRPRQHAS